MNMTEPNTKHPPTRNGMCGEYISASIPAVNGAIADPIKRKKLYAADAVDLSIGAAFITAVVINVLLFPSSAPENMIHAITTHWVDVQTPIIKRTTANAVNIMHMDLTVPNFSWSLGAMKMDVTARRIPHATNTKPMP